MSFETEIQKAVYLRLDDQLSTPVYDNVPQTGDTGDSSDFPYVVVGADTHNPWDTDTELGADSTITIHVWSRYRGMAEVKQIQGQIYDALHRYDLQVTDYHTVGVEYEYSESLLDPDGQTRQGVQRFRITIEED